MKGCVFYRKQRTCREINYGGLCNLHSDGKGGSGNNDIGSKKKRIDNKTEMLHGTIQKNYRETDREIAEKPIMEASVNFILMVKGGSGPKLFLSWSKLKIT